MGQKNDFKTFILVIRSFLEINLCEILVNDKNKQTAKQKTEKKNQQFSWCSKLHNMFSYNDVTFDAEDHVKKINCDQISILLKAS